MAFCGVLLTLLQFGSMAKQKNTTNKKLHTKLMDQKKRKVVSSKEANKSRIREMNQRANQKVDIEGLA